MSLNFLGLDNSLVDYSEFIFENHVKSPSDAVIYVISLDFKFLILKIQTIKLLNHQVFCR